MKIDLCTEDVARLKNGLHMYVDNELECLRTEIESGFVRELVVQHLDEVRDSLLTMATLDAKYPLVVEDDVLARQASEARLEQAKAAKAKRESRGRSNR